MVDLEELLIPWFNIICSLLLVVIILRRGRVVLVVCGPLNHLKGEREGWGGRAKEESREGKREKKGRIDYR